MSSEGKLVLAIICLVAGVAVFLFGDKELKVKSGVVTQVLFPRREHPVKGKLIGAGLLVIAMLLCWQVATK